MRFPGLFQDNEKRMRRLEKQLATLSSALGPAAAAALEAAESGSSASGDLFATATGNPCTAE